MEEIIVESERRKIIQVSSRKGEYGGNICMVYSDM